MPKIIHPSALVNNAPIQITPTTVCNFNDPLSNVMQQTDTPIENIKTCIQRYEDFIGHNLPQNEADKVVRYSNFRIKDIQDLINQNPDCSFIRTYNCIDILGNHFKIAVPVKKEIAGKSKADVDTNYIMDCCRCKPDCGTNLGF